MLKLTRNALLMRLDLKKDRTVMKRLVSLFVLLIPVTVFAGQTETSFKPMFDGQSLAGWKGDMEFWRVEDGIIIGESTAEKPLKNNTFLVWDNGTVDDFEFKVKFRISGSNQANSGIQFRGVQRDDGHVVGYQADIDRAGQWAGALYDEAARGILAVRGQKGTVDETGKVSNETVADKDELWKKITIDDWNEYTITARGNHITLKINGVVTSEVIDNDPKGLDRSGILALQLHSGPPMKIEFKDIQLKRLPLEEGWKKVVLVAGRPSHAYFAHEHNAGCLLLAKSLDAAQKTQGLKVVSSVYLNGWPKDVSAFDNADTVVAYCDGGGNHFLNKYLDIFDKMVESRHVGLVCLHYGVETVKGEPGDYFLKWMGGYFEPHWSVNPHWDAKYETFPDHPIANGVKPFEIRDEWYYHMRFVEGMKGVTPILTALPPRETLDRPDGPHSGNPAVREAVLVKKEPQHTAWAYERPDGKGRGFGFTGGHFHINWQHDQFRKLVLNAIVWTANGEVPKDGVSSPTPDETEMKSNQDEQQPKDFKYMPFAGR
jgi:type 1 glutamine amidotransferase